MKLQEAQQIVDDWIKNVGVRYFNELTNTAILNEEVGELSSLMARIYGEQSFKLKSDEERAMESLEGEMADVLFVLICLANQCGIDLEAAFVKSIDKKTKRDKDRHKNNEKL
jgi:NTP pyrophosphatase (non-canonical NTP hydrolase)